MLRTRRDPSPFPWRWVVPLLWLAMLTAGFIAPSWAFGAWMPARTISAVCVVFVVGWLVVLYLWTPLLVPHLNRTSRLIEAVAIVILGMSLFLPGTAYAAAHDFYHRIRPWHSAVEHRYALLRHAAGSDALVPHLATRPWVLLDGEIVNDPGDYRNWGMVSFFHLRSIRLIPANGSPPPPPLHPTRPPAKGI